MVVVGLLSVVLVGFVIPVSVVLVVVCILLLAPSLLAHSAQKVKRHGSPSFYSLPTYLVFVIVEVSS